MNTSGQNELVSIVMPVKNTGQYLEPCLNSIRTQNYENWELIVVDDHSEDNSFDILQKYAQLDPRFNVLRNEGHGIIPALQKAYRHTSRGYITRMDSDDLMPAEKLSTLAQLLTQYGKGYISTGLVRYFSDDGLMGGYQKYQDWLNDLALSGKQFEEIYRECVVPSPCWMMHTRDFDRIGGFKSDHYPEDYDLCFRMRNHDLKLVAAPKILHLWRDYPSRTSRTDANYSDNRFLDLKLHHYLRVDYDPKRPLILWGAGKKAKTIAKSLDNQGFTFDWLCNNEQKIGHNIYGQILKSTADLPAYANPQIIVTVAGELVQNQIKTQLSSLNLLPISNFYFFC